MHNIVKPRKKGLTVYSSKLNNAHMNPTDTIEEIRRNNLRILIKECDPPTGVALGAKCKTSASYLSQILTRFKMESGKSREMGSELARKLEKGCEKPEGWMDVVHHEGDIESSGNEIVNLYFAMDSTMRSVLVQQAKMLLQITKK